MPQHILCVLAGDDIDDAILADWALCSDKVYAADGAANRLRRLGLRCDAIVGDLDSVENFAGETAEVVEVEDQNHTDCDKLLSFCQSRGHENVTVIGVEGTLPDHVLSTLYSFVRSDLRIRIVYRSGFGWIVRPGIPVEMIAPVGARISLIPLIPCAEVRFLGVNWPLDGARMDVKGLVSVSNKVSEDRVSARVGTGAALLFLETETPPKPIWDI